MAGNLDQPQFEFMIAVPSNLAANPPLASSLQSFETALLLLALGRYPSALVSTGSALESALKAKLRLPPDKIRYLGQMLDDLRPLPASLEHFAPEGQKTNKQKRFTEMRNRIVHYGFSPRDDETCLVMLLETGFPFLYRTYEEYFDIALDSRDEPRFLERSPEEVVKCVLSPQIADHLRIATQVYMDGRRLKLPDRTYCVGALQLFIIRDIERDRKPKNFADVFFEGLSDAMSDDELETLNDLERRLGDLSWPFICPACNHDSARFAFDEARFEEGVIAPTVGVCVKCGFFVTKEEPFLAERLLADQVATHREAILEANGYIPPDDPEDDDE